jgi:hypothetical protein
MYPAANQAVAKKIQEQYLLRAARHPANLMVQSAIIQACMLNAHISFKPPKEYSSQRFAFHLDSTKSNRGPKLKQEKQYELANRLKGICNPTLELQNPAY